MEKNGECLHFYGLFGMYNPFLLNGMSAAVDRIVRAVNNREKIVIYGYHDIDGVTAVSVLLLVLRYLNADVEYFISDQTEGDFYADSENMKKSFRFLGVRLIITVGCGANSFSGMDPFTENDVDIIVTDYHDFEEASTKSIIINPKKKSCRYPFKGLTAVGLAYKLSQAISVYYRMKRIDKYLDLVMIGTVSKTQTFHDENRIIVEEGMHRLKQTNNYGLRAIMKSNKTDLVDPDVVEKIISNGHSSMNNSRGVDNARIMVELFTTASSDRAEQIAKYLKKEIKHKQVNLI
ncbi:MAG: phosphoesterase RecJ domain protein [Firmicutes bacterium]|nr:phosphoesterase RecJ domain protein [Bacillota bacterium]